MNSPPQFIATDAVFKRGQIGLLGTEQIDAFMERLIARRGKVVKNRGASVNTIG